MQEKAARFQTEIATLAKKIPKIFSEKINPEIRTPKIKPGKINQKIFFRKIRLKMQSVSAVHE